MRESLNRLINGISPVSEDPTVATSKLRRERPAKKQKTEGRNQIQTLENPSLPKLMGKFAEKAAFKSLVAWRRYYNGTKRRTNSPQVRLHENDAHSISNRKASASRPRRQARFWGWQWYSIPYETTHSRGMRAKYTNEGADPRTVGTRKLSCGCTSILPLMISMNYCVKHMGEE